MARYVLKATVLEAFFALVAQVLRVLAKRRPGLTQQSHYRRAVGNIEGFVEESVPQHLHHPLLLRYCAFVASDCIARGVCSALPDILLFAAAPPNCIAIGSIILGASPNATMRTPRFGR